MMDDKMHLKPRVAMGGRRMEMEGDGDGGGGRWLEVV